VELWEVDDVVAVVDDFAEGVQGDAFKLLLYYFEVQDVDDVVPEGAHVAHHFQWHFLHPVLQDHQEEY
jgi:hypothetical protein